MLRRIRTCASVLCVIFGIALVVLWIRSYEMSDELNGWLGPQRFTLGSREGRAVAGAVGPEANAYRGWKWRLRSNDTRVKKTFVGGGIASEADVLFAPGDLQRQCSSLGFGIIHRPCYYSLRPIKAPDGRITRLQLLPNRTMYCSGLIVPYWFLLLLTGVVFAAVRLNGELRYNIRGLFLAMTFLSILLGLIVTVDRTTAADECEPFVSAAMNSVGGSPR